MDIFSHGLWGAAAFGRNNGAFTKKSFWKAFMFGVGPDLFSFGIFFFASLSGFSDAPSHSHFGPPDPASIPPYVYMLYNVTHSLVVFVALFCLLWAYFKKPVWESLAWGLHILVDIPTHSYAFFPTPFLWPFFSFKFDGWSWGSPWIFFPDVIALIIVYAWLYSKRKKK